MSPAAPPIPSGIRVKLPPKWFALGLAGNEDTGAAGVARQVDQRISLQPELRVFRQAMIDPLLSLSGNLARQPGRLFAALRWDKEGASLIMATLIVTRYRREPMPLLDALESIAGLVATRQRTDEFDPRVSRRSLQLGEAVRMEALREPEPKEGARQPLRLVIDHWIPVAGATATIKVACSTASLAYASFLVPEFDAIAASISFVNGS